MTFIELNYYWLSVQHDVALIDLHTVLVFEAGLLHEGNAVWS